MNEAPLTDLFGNPVSVATAHTRSGRRVGIGGRGFRGGYFMQPGSGTAAHPGETCWTCEHYCRRQGGVKAYPKCGRMMHAWTGGPGSDIKARSPACSGWEPVKEDAKHA